MNTVNETGPHKGRYLFTVFETAQAGVQRSFEVVARVFEALDQTYERLTRPF